MNENRSLRLSEWVAIFGSLITVVVITKAANLDTVWQTASAYTDMVFVSVIIAMRSAWGRSNFWLALGALFLLHALGVFFAIREFPATSRKFHGVPLIISGAIECLFILGFVSRASRKKSRSVI